MRQLPFPLNSIRTFGFHADRFSGLGKVLAVHQETNTFCTEMLSPYSSSAEHMILRLEDQEATFLPFKGQVCPMVYRLYTNQALYIWNPAQWQDFLPFWGEVRNRIEAEAFFKAVIDTVGFDYDFDKAFGDYKKPDGSHLFREDTLRELDRKMDDAVRTKNFSATGTAYNLLKEIEADLAKAMQMFGCSLEDAILSSPHK